LPTGKQLIAGSRDVLKTAGAASVVLELDVLVAARARSTQALNIEPGTEGRPQVFELAIREQGLVIADGPDNAMTINDSILRCNSSDLTVQIVSD